MRKYSFTLERKSRDNSKETDGMQCNLKRNTAMPDIRSSEAGPGQGRAGKGREGDGKILL